VIILSISENHLLDMERIAAKNIVPCFTIGRVKNNNRLKMNESIDISLDDLKNVYTNAIPDMMKVTV